MVSKVSDVLVGALNEPLGYAINWGRIWSLWPVHLETACCSVEFGATSSPRYDCEGFGIIEAFGSLRQCDLIVVQGTVTRKMAPRLRMVYDQMPDPKYVIAMGACSITGGLYIDSYNVLPGVDGILPVDVYVPGCPPRPETLIQGCMLLQEKIKRSKIKWQMCIKLCIKYFLKIIIVIFGSKTLRIANHLSNINKGNIMN